MFSLGWKEKFKRVVTKKPMTERECEEWRETNSGSQGEDLNLPGKFFPKPYRRDEEDSTS